MILSDTHCGQVMLALESVFVLILGPNVYKMLQMHYLLKKLVNLAMYI